MVALDPTVEVRDQESDLVRRHQGREEQLQPHPEVPVLHLSHGVGGRHRPVQYTHLTRARTGRLAGVVVMASTLHSIAIMMGR